MNQLTPCPSCTGLVPAHTSTCPHCEASVSSPSPLLSRLARGVLGVAGGSTLAITLMACYGLPPCEDTDDEDSDGSYGQLCAYGDDCDDTNADIHPGADDPEGDDIDQNCDGVDGIAEADAGVTDAGTGNDAGGNDAGANDDAGTSADAGM